MGKGRWFGAVLAAGTAIALTLAPAGAGAQAPTSPLALLAGLSAGGVVPVIVQGYQVGPPASQVTFSGSAVGGPGSPAASIHGNWSATVGLTGAPVVGPAPETLSVSGGTLTLVVAGQTLTIQVGAARLSLLPGTPTGTAPSGASASAASAAVPPGVPPGTLVPSGVLGAEEALQVLAATWAAAHGQAQLQGAITAEAQAVLAAFPALQALGPFPYQGLSNRVMEFPHVLNPPSGADQCGDVVYPAHLSLTLESVASGSFDGELIAYRTDTVAGCTTIGTAVAGLLTITPSASASGA